MYVVVQSCTCDGTCQSVPYGANRSMDRNVYGLDDSCSYLYGTIKKQKMACTSGYLMFIADDDGSCYTTSESGKIYF